MTNITLWLSVESVIIYVICIAIIWTTKILSRRYSNKLRKLPIPGELFVVIFFTIFTTFFEYAHKIEKVGEIPAAFPNPTVPSLHAAGEAIGSVIPLAIISYIFNLSLAKKFAAEFGYTVDANQEANCFDYRLFHQQHFWLILFFIADNSLTLAYFTSSVRRRNIAQELTSHETTRILIDASGIGFIDYAGFDDLKMILKSREIVVYTTNQLTMKTFYDFDPKVNIYLILWRHLFNPY